MFFEIKDSLKQPIPFGLKFWPTLEPEYSDKEHDFPKYLHLQSPNGDNSIEVLEIVKDLSYVNGNIMEIGVGLYEPSKSFTPLLIKGLQPWGRYLGVDIEDRSKFIVEQDNINAFFLKSDSKNQSRIREQLKLLQINELDILLIDGNHSVECAVNDWLYVDLLSDCGIVIIHDTNSHPGPKSLMEAIDRNIFEVEQPLINKKDYGIAICRKK